MNPKSTHQEPNKHPPPSISTMLLPPTLKRSTHTFLTISMLFHHQKSPQVIHNSLLIAHFDQ